jgi:hypothetical protein
MWLLPLFCTLGLVLLQPFQITWQLVSRPFLAQSPLGSQRATECDNPTQILAGDEVAGVRVLGVRQQCSASYFYPTRGIGKSWTPYSEVARINALSAVASGIFRRFASSRKAAS